MEHYKQLFPNKLRLYRMKYGYKQKEVAALVGIACPTDIAKWENGSKLPALTNLMRLCIVYRTTVYDLYDEYMSQLMAEISSKELASRE